MAELLTKKNATIIAGVLLALAWMAALDGNQAFWRGWLVYGLVGLLGILLVWATWRAVIAAENGPKWATVSAFAARLVVGVLLALLLPIFTNSETTLAGYVFKDAAIRDRQSWELAKSHDTLLVAFTHQSVDPQRDYNGDQYGGTMAVEAFLYRYFSPDAHRAWLIFLLNAALAACGVIWIWKAACDWFGRPTANLAAWIFALYPESVLLGASQMREAFVIPAVALALYGLAAMNMPGKKQNVRWMISIGTAAVILLLFQPPVAMIVFIALVFAWLLDPRRTGSWQRVVFLIAVLLVAGAVAAIIWANLPFLPKGGILSVLYRWLQENFVYQSSQAVEVSGLLTKVIESVSKPWRWLIISVYGLAQPVLPALVGDPQAVWLMRLINLLRSAGWYAMAPLLVYGLFGAVRAKDDRRRNQMAWLLILVWVWAFISALNAGGDQWDNPRYRAILLAFEALLAAWAWMTSRQLRDAWLPRWLIIEAIFIFVFTIWYIGRYYIHTIHLDIFVSIAITLVLSAVVLVGGWLLDRRRQT